MRACPNNGSTRDLQRLAAGAGSSAPPGFLLQWIKRHARLGSSSGAGKQLLQEISGRFLWVSAEGDADTAVGAVQAPQLHRALALAGDDSLKKSMNPSSFLIFYYFSLLSLFLSSGAEAS